MRYLRNECFPKRGHLVIPFYAAMTLTGCSSVEVSETAYPSTQTTVVNIYSQQQSPFNMPMPPIADESPPYGRELVEASVAAVGVEGVKHIVEDSTDAEHPGTALSVSTEVPKAMPPDAGDTTATVSTTDGAVTAEGVEGGAAARGVVAGSETIAVEEGAGSLAAAAEATETRSLLGLFIEGCIEVFCR